MKKTKKLTDRLIEELERTPLVQIACEKHGISRNTFYRWLKEDNDFMVRVSEAMSLGTGVVHDVAVSNVLNGIKSKDVVYTKYWLSHRHPEFRRPFIHREDLDDPLQHKRLLDSEAQLLKTKNEIKEAKSRLYDEKVKEAEIRMRKFQDKWFVKKE
jgi:transposase-like protein